MTEYFIFYHKDDGEFVINKYEIQTGGNEYLTFLAPKVVSIKFVFTTSTESTRESREKRI